MADLEQPCELELPEHSVTVEVTIKDWPVWEKKLAIAEKLIAILEEECGVEVKRVDPPPSE